MRLLITGWLLLALGVTFMVTFNVIGSHVDDSGTLHEPFALIPLAWLCWLTGTLFVVIASIRNRRRR